MHLTQVDYTAYSSVVTHRRCNALQALQTSRGPIPLRSDDIVAGEREVTLGLLWRIFQHFEASRQSSWFD